MTKPLAIPLWIFLALVATSSTWAQAPEATQAHEVAATSEEDCSDNEDAEVESDPCVPKKHSGRITLGAGYSPDEKFMLGASVAQDRLFGTDHGLRLGSLISQRRQEFNLEYTNPHLFDSDRELQLELHHRRMAYSAFTQERIGGSLKISRELGSGLGVYLGYRGERVSSDLLPPSSLALVQGPSSEPAISTEGLVAALRAGVTYDNKQTHKRRKKAEFFVERSSPWLGSDYDLVRAGAKGSYRQPLLGPLSLHLSGGAEVVMSRPGTLVPLAERLHFEGHADTRGFELGSAGFDLGGTTKATGSAELEFPIISRWGISGALFYDAGVLGNERATDVVQSVGGSLLFDTPIGPLRLDLAFPLGEERGPNLLFSVGNSF